MARRHRGTGPCPAPPRGTRLAGVACVVRVAVVLQAVVAGLPGGLVSRPDPAAGTHVLARLLGFGGSRLSRGIDVGPCR
jgi:hypothetical protein